MYGESCSNLVVVQKSVDLTKTIYKLAELMPLKEKYFLTEKLILSSFDIHCKIADGHAAFSAKVCRYRMEEARRLNSDVRKYLIRCLRRGYFSESQIEYPLSLCKEIDELLEEYIKNIPEEQQ